jgi:hypothetical protein
MTTSSTTAVIQHADFTPSQIGPIDDTGVPISCNQLSTDISDTGMVLVGQVPVIFNPPAGQDVMLSLHFPCVEATVKPTPTARPTSTPKP